MKKTILICIVLFSAIFFSFWKVDQFQNMDGEIVEAGAGNLLLMKAKAIGVPIDQVLELDNTISHTWQEHNYIRRYILRDYTYCQPLNSFLLFTVFNLFGVSVLNMVILSSIISFIIIILTFFMGRAMYGHEVGILSALLISSLLYFLILTKAGYGVWTLYPLTALVAIYFWFLAHKRKEKLYLYVSGAAVSLVWLTGWYGLPLVFVIFLGFILWSIRILGFFRNPNSRLRSYTELKQIWTNPIPSKKDNFLFSIKDYLFAVAVFLATLLFLSISYSLYFNISPFDTFYGPIWMLTVYGESRIDAGLVNVVSFIKQMFITMVPYAEGGSHPGMNLVGKPLVNRLVSVFLFLGLIFLIKRRSMVDKTCLLWMGVPFLTFSVFIRFHPRYLLLAAPVICIIAAEGIMEFLRLSQSKVAALNISSMRKRRIKQAILLIVCLSLALNAVFTYNDFFVDYVKEPGNQGQYAGQTQISKYIRDSSESNDAQVVLGDPHFVNYVFFFFNTAGKPYPTVYYDDIITNHLNFWSLNLRELKEAKITFSYDTLEGSREFLWNTSDNYLVTIPSTSKSEISHINVKGSIINPTISNDKNTLRLPMTFFPNDEIDINYDGNSKIMFKRLITSEDFRLSVFEQKNITFKYNNPLLMWAELNNVPGGYKLGSEGYLIYKLDSPYEMTNLTVTSYPNIFNDLEKKNSLSLLYSIDNVNYAPVYEIKSNGDGGLSGTFSKNEHIVNLYSKTVYLKFVFRGHGNPFATLNPTQIQLWSTNEYPMTFVANINTSSATKFILKPGLNTFKLSTDESDFIWEHSLQKKFRDFEKETLLKKDKIYYVFSISPYDPYYPSIGFGKDIWDANNKNLLQFQELYPGLEPAKIIYYSNGEPHYAIYVVKSPYNTSSLRQK